MDEAQKAAAIFGATSPPQAAPTAPKGTTGERSAAERMFGGSPEPRKDAFADLRPSWAPDAKPADDQAKPETANGEAKSEARPGDAESDEAKGEPVNLDAVAEEVGLDRDHPAYAEFGAVVDELGLSREGVEKLVEFDSKRTAQAWEKIGTDWLAQAKASPTYQADVTSAKALLRAHADDDLMDMLETYRLGNSPAVIRFLGRVGRALGHR